MRTLLLLLLMVLVLASSVQAATDDQVEATIERMRSWLYSRQNPSNGTWMQDREYHLPQAHQRGETAVVIMALLLSGDSVHDELVPRVGHAKAREWNDLSRPERLARAARYLHDIGYEGFNGTYSVAMRMHCWSLMPVNRPSLKEQDAQWLLRAHRGSLFDYGPRRTERVDHAISLLGILAVWEHAKMGGQVPRSFWIDAAAHFIKTQESDGGWTQMPGTGQASQGAMTAAGVAVLLIARQQLADASMPQQFSGDMAQAIEKGLAWLDGRFTGLNQQGVDRHHYQWLYDLQLVGLLSGIRTFNSRDWYETGVRDILARLRPDGSVEGNQLDTAYALAFLARGRAPIWIGKLQLPREAFGASGDTSGGGGNNRPNDVYGLTQFLSRQYERDLRWQVISVDSDSQAWQMSVLYLASDQAVQFTARQKQNIKNYLDRGGTLLASPDRNAREFIQSIQDLARDLYPGASMKPITGSDEASMSDHPLSGLLFQVAPEHARQVQVLSNGVRDLLILAPQDWGAAFQNETPAVTQPHWQIICNLYANVTGGGKWPSPEEVAFPRRMAYRRQNGELTVVRARHGANWNAEPLAWQAMATLCFNRAGLEVKVEQETLARIGSSKAALVHLAGTGTLELSDAEVQAIRQYVQQGGTILIEALGGNGEFLPALEKQLGDAFGTMPVPLSATSSIISGEGLMGGYDNRRTTYRPPAVLRFATGTQPRLAALMVQDRPAIIFSPHDLTSGMLGTRHWHINGYTPASARKLMMNILLVSTQRPIDSNSM